MSADTQTATAPVFELPEDAPRVRITAGVGSATQKTWTIRRPVTLIGSRRPAHIVLHDRDISEAHCVIVNTGTEVLLKDLHTRSGTHRNNTPINLAVLKDGDVITIGMTIIQIAIKSPEGVPLDKVAASSGPDPTRFPMPVSLELVDGEQQWKLRESVVLIGRHEAAPIWLDHEDISPRHALIFRFRKNPVLFDLGGPGGVWVNGRPVSLAKLFSGDRVTIGSFRFRLALLESEARRAPAANVQPISRSPDGVSRDNGADGDFDRQTRPKSSTLVPSFGQTSAELDQLRENIATAWERLNAWQAAAVVDPHAVKPTSDEIAAREAELDALDASLRGQLHDVSRLHERLLARKRELEAQYLELEQQRDQIDMMQTQFTEREMDLAARTEELTRRERVVTHRWNRIQSATCPHCRKRLNSGPSSVDPDAISSG